MIISILLLANAKIWCFYSNPDDTLLVNLEFDVTSGSANITPVAFGPAGLTYINATHTGAVGVVRDSITIPAPYQGPYGIGAFVTGGPFGATVRIDTSGTGTSIHSSALGTIVFRPPGVVSTAPGPGELTHLSVIAGYYFFTTQP